MQSLTNLDENEFFREATLRICGSLDPDGAMQNLLEYLKDIFPLIGVGMGRFDATANAVCIQAWAALENHKNPYPIIRIPLQYKKTALKLANSKQKLSVLNDLEKVPAWVRDLWCCLGPLSSSNAVMHLDLDGQRIGIFFLVAKNKFQFTEQNLHLITLLHDPVAIALSNALKFQEVARFKDMLADDNRYLNRQLMHISGDTIIGTHSGLKGVMEMVRQVAHLDSPVLLLGETGVGKEVIANALHRYSKRKDGPFIKVNCGAIPDTLVDSELFGHEKGAFTGAVEQKRGRFERAQNGTIFMDEIGDLPPAVQVRLLRVIQNKEIERVGGISSLPVNVRIISATHRNLQEMIATSQFREDLWFRLNVFPIIIPPLRQRKEDIPALIHHLIKRKSIEIKLDKIPVVGPEDLEKLIAYHWPGNVRELENIVERALIRSQGEDRNGLLNFENLKHLNGKVQNEQPPCSGEGIMSFEQAMTRHIRQAMQLSSGKVNGPQGAAQLLKLRPNTLRGKMKKLGISYGREN